MQAQYLVTFQGPAIVSTDPTVSFFDPTTLNPGSTLSVPGAFQMLSLPDGSELYFIMNTGGTPGPAITAVHPRSRTTVGSAHQIGNFANTLNCAALSPDGSRLIVGENSVHVFDTGTNIDLTPNGIAVGDGATIVGITVSYDSQTAYALGTYNGNSYLSAIGIPQLEVTSTLNIAGTGSAVGLGPNGLLYAGVTNQIMEINPATMAATPNGVVAVNATPGPIAFTPDGNYLVAANQLYGTQPAILLLNLNDHLVEGTVPFTGLSALTSSQLTGQPAVFDSLYVASSNTIYPFSSGGQSLFDLQLGTNGGLILNVPIIAGISSTTQAAMALSNDLGVPGRNFPQYLFSISNESDPSGIISLFRVDPASSLLTSQVPLLYSTPGAVAYYAPTFTNNQPNTILQYGDNQTLLPGGVTLPLVIRVLDQNGLPIAGTGVSFTPPYGITGTIEPINTVTGADGYAQAIFTAGSTPADIGTFTITVGAGPLSQAFTINVGTPAPPPAALTVVSGQGQLIMEDLSEGSPSDPEPLVVQATDSNGNPVVNTLVTFTVTAGNGALQSPTGAPQNAVVTTTNASGQAIIRFLPPLVGVPEGFEQDTVTASVTVTGATSSGTTTISQNFYVTSMPLNTSYCSAPPCYPPVIPVIAQVVQPAAGTVFKGAAGSTLLTPVMVQVYAMASGRPLANANVTVTTGTSTTAPNASCAGANGGGMALTDATGLATCNVLLNGVPGTAPLTIDVPLTGVGNGSGLVFNGYTLTITAGAPANINILTGNNQTSVTNTSLPVPFIISVTDSLNTPLPGIPLVWKVTAGSMTLSGASTTTALNGEAIAYGFVNSPGGTMITLQVTAGGTASATITTLVYTPPASIAIVSGNNQNAPINQALSQPLVVQALDSKGNPTPYAPLTFIPSGTVKLNDILATADATGTASVQVTSVGAVAGTQTVIAEYFLPKNSPSISFTLTAQPVGPTGASIVSSASLMPGIAPGGLVTFMGSGLTPTITGVVTDPAQMQGYSVSFDGITAPILALVNENGNGQINAQVPFEEQPGSFDSVTIATPHGSIGINDVTVSYYAPAIFTNGTLAPGEPLAVAMRPDGSYVSASNPLQRGENVTFFATGLGQTTPLAATGVLGVPEQIVNGTLYAGVNNQGDAVVSAVYQPNALGLYAITMQVPATTTPGPAQPLSLLMVDPQGNGYNAPPAYIPIQ
jgi:uncharacterized protein (TIGR03437 family)